MSPALQGKVSAYQSVAAHGGVAAADPHQLIMMLLDGALARIVQAQACNARAQRHERNRHLERAVAIVSELRASLDLSRGPLARNLDDLYEFVSRQLLLGQLTSEVKPLESSASILHEIRAAWSALQPMQQAQRRQASQKGS
jgi:flagellar secretion chaperone FliS